jgi:putative ABC transport system permease protein
MIRFLIKGLLRDRNRSLIPVAVTTIGVMLTVVFHSWITGVMGDSIEFNAKFSTGHVKIMTAAYAENLGQMPVDLALLGSDSLVIRLKKEFPSMSWAERIYFGGLIDVPDSVGETKAQGTVLGFGIDLLSDNAAEAERMNITKSLKSGRLPSKEGELLLSNSLSDKLGLKPGDRVTIISSTMYGEMAVSNFILAGTVEFGTNSLDRGTVICDLKDVRNALNMENASGEILGFFNSGYYDDDLAGQVISRFDEIFSPAADEFSPVIRSLKQQNGMALFVDFAAKLLGILVSVFIMAMSIVLWNAGLLGGLRRYGEFGMRLAIGEEKGHIYRTMIFESLAIGITGSVIGSAIGLVFSFLLQKNGIDIGDMMKDAAMMMPTVFRARITPMTWYIGFVPGVFSALIGTMLSGIGIYKRQTAQLFKELEA